MRVQATREQFIRRERYIVTAIDAELSDAKGDLDSPIHCVSASQAVEYANERIKEEQRK